MNHKSVRLSQEDVESYFTSNIILNQDVLTTSAKWQKVLVFIPDEELKANLNDLWTRNPNLNPQSKWLGLVNSVKDFAAKKPQKRAALLSSIPESCSITRMRASMQTSRWT
ncbi:hypothetical protein BC829DRAFT_238149 [Chytridium lagenaria]|nr:hypothetical protein BC829DRAFT_238149 [Chytridium lagenaria]